MAGLRAELSRSRRKKNEEQLFNGRPKAAVSWGDSAVAFGLLLKTFRFEKTVEQQHKERLHVAKPKPSTNKKEPNEITFEQSLEELEQIVRQLEDGKSGLSDSLAQYEKGIAHLKRCYEALRGAEQKIEMLTGLDAEGNPRSQPFDEEDMTLEQKQQARSRRRSQSGAESSTTGLADDVDASDGLF